MSYDIWGYEDDVKKNKNQIEKLAEKYGGVSAGEKNGERGYLLTFTIGYLRVKILLLFISLGKQILLIWTEQKKYVDYMKFKDFRL